MELCTVLQNVYESIRRVKIELRAYKLKLFYEQYVKSLGPFPGHGRRNKTLSPLSDYHRGLEEKVQGKLLILSLAFIEK